MRGNEPKLCSAQRGEINVVDAVNAAFKVINSPGKILASAKLL